MVLFGLLISRFGIPQQILKCSKHVFRSIQSYLNYVLVIFIFLRLLIESDDLLSVMMLIYAVGIDYWIDSAVICMKRVIATTPSFVYGSDKESIVDLKTLLEEVLTCYQKCVL